MPWGMALLASGRVGVGAGSGVLGFVVGAAGSLLMPPQATKIALASARVTDLSKTFLFMVLFVEV